MIVTKRGPQNIGQVKTHFESANLFLSPEEYQRENSWKVPQKKLLIDTIFRGMDIPKLYIWKIDHETLVNGYPNGDTKDLYKKILEKKRTDNDDPDPYIFEMVDGQQRTRTILEYMGVTPPNKEVFRGLWGDAFPALEDTPMAKGRKYVNLNADQQIRFNETSLTIMVLEKANIDEIRDMFLRLQNGTPLNAQQKRDAMGSSISKIVREIADSHFFKTSVYFDNNSAAHHLVASQMLYLEYKGKIVSCTSQRLDKFYKDHRNIKLTDEVVKKAKNILSILKFIFPQKNPFINRSYALSLYWAISRIIETYEIPDSYYAKIRENFESLENVRILANKRDYKDANDEIYSILSLSMSRRTDGEEGINDRHDVLTQFIFNGVDLTIKQQLDPNRNFTHEEKLILYYKAKGRCQLECNGKICGREIDFDDAVVDHITPHSKGGKTILQNGRIAYHTCNISRGNRDGFDPGTMCHLIIHENGQDEELV